MEGCKLTKIVKGEERCIEFRSCIDLTSRRVIGRCRRFIIPIYSMEVCDECEFYE